MFNVNNVLAEQHCSLRNDHLRNELLKGELEDRDRGDNSLLQFRKKLPSYQMQRVSSLYPMFLCYKQWNSALANQIVLPLR